MRLAGPGLEAANLLARFDRPWHFAAGWAIDLFLNRVRREHKDADIAIDYKDQLALRELLLPRDLAKVVDHKLVPWPGEPLEPPVFQFFAGEQLEFLLETRAEDAWIFRRNPAVKMPAARAFMRSEDGIPFLNPAIVLLFKSRHLSETDRQDFADTLPALPEIDRQWLTSAIALADSNHPWL